MFFCGTFSITSNSRMMYAFARDGGIPGHKFFHKVDVKRKSPIRTVWLACTLSFILGLPSLGSSVAFSAATSIATIGLYISYGMFLYHLLRMFDIGLKEFRAFSTSHPNCIESHQSSELRPRSLPPRILLLSCRAHCCPLDHIHLHRIYTTSREPRRFADPQLRCRRCRYRHRVFTRVLVDLGEEVVYGTH